MTQQQSEETDIDEINSISDCRFFFDYNPNLGGVILLYVYQNFISTQTAHPGLIFER